MSIDLQGMSSSFDELDDDSSKPLLSNEISPIST